MKKMNKNLEVGTAYVEAKSILDVNVKPVILTIGGFSVKDKKTGKKINFDWSDSYGDVDLDTKGGFEVSWRLENFDYECMNVYGNISDVFENQYPYISEERENKIFTELNELCNGKTLEQFLTECEIEEIFYEAYLDRNERMCFPLEITEFKIGNFEFSKEELNKYTEKVFGDIKKRLVENINVEFNKYAKENNVKSEHHIIEEELKELLNRTTEIDGVEVLEHVPTKDAERIWLCRYKDVYVTLADIGNGHWSFVKVLDLV